VKLPLLSSRGLKARGDPLALNKRTALSED